MKRIFIALAALLVVLWPFAVAHARFAEPSITIPCGVSIVPVNTYTASPINQNETVTLTFHASGQGLITLGVNNYSWFYWARTDASCGNCTLVVPNVPPGPYNQMLSISATVASDTCPSNGVTVSDFVLHISPSNSHQSIR